MSQYPITLTGRLTRDPILTKTSTGAYKAKLRVASSRRIPDRQVDAGANDPEGHNSKAPQWRDVDHSVPQQPAERGDTAADTAADRYLAERAAAARSGEEEPYDAEAEEAAEAESATVNA